MAVRLSGGIHRQKHKSIVLASVFIGLSMVITAMIIVRHLPAAQPPKKEQVFVAEFDTVSIPVPVSAVAAGTKGKDIRFKFVSYPKQQLPGGVVTDVASIKDWTTTAPLPSDLPLFENNFARNFSTTNPVVEKIPEGMRAMTIRVDATSAVEGWAGSGALVDVLLITKDRTRVVAEKVKILSAERSVSPVEGANAPSVPSTVTLLVTQEQCLAINTAIPLGKIAFALRNATDEKQWADTLYTSEQLKGASVKQKSAAISGYVSVKGEEKHYALADGKWIKADVPPSGFFDGGR